MPLAFIGTYFILLHSQFIFDILDTQNYWIVRFVTIPWVASIWMRITMWQIVFLVMLCLHTARRMFLSGTSCSTFQLMAPINFSNSIQIRILMFFTFERSIYGESQAKGERPQRKRGRNIHPLSIWMALSLIVVGRDLSNVFLFSFQMCLQITLTNAILFQQDKSL